MQTSESGQGRAVNVVSAASNGHVPVPPLLPMGWDIMPPTDLIEQYENVYDIVKEIQEDGEQKQYPPGGQEVEEEYIITEGGNKVDKYEEDKADAERRNPAKDDKSGNLISKTDTAKENYKDTMNWPNRVLGEEYEELSNEEWVLRFIQLGGFQFLFNLFTSEDTFFKKAITDVDMLTAEEKECVCLVLELITVIMGSAHLANDKCFLPNIEIIKNKKSQSKELSKVDEDAEMVDADPYELDEEKLMSSVGNAEPKRQRTVSTIAQEENAQLIYNLKMDQYNYFNEKAPNLMKILTGEYGDKIMKEFSYQSFIKKSMTIISTILVRRATSNVDELILEKLLAMKVLMYLQNHDLIEYLYDFKEDIKLNSATFKIDIKEFLIRGLTFTTYSNIKQLFLNFLNVLSIIKHTKKARLPLILILETFKDHFFDTIKNSSRYYGYQEFYTCFCDLIHKYFEMENQRNKQFENVLVPKVFLKQLVNILKDYKSKEKRNTILEDHCLIGIFNVIEQILNDKPELTEEIALEQGLLLEVFFNCLFQETVEAPQVDLTANFDLNSTEFHTNKCKTKESRAKAFSLLSCMCSKSEKVREKVYSDCLIKMVSLIERPENFEHVSDSDSRSMSSYAGLKNLGATCYMNSMLQQLFMIPAFKYLLLSVDDEKGEDLQTSDDDKSVYHNKMIDDNLLHQFQNTMAFLELTERPSYNAIGLCFSMKDYSGNPTNCSLQQDSQEFVNLAFDRLETLIKPTPQKHLFSDIFSAKQCTHMSCSNCDHVKQKIEDYYILSLPVKNLHNLEESFNAYTDGEVISDFRCDNCEQKVEIKKHSSFVDMPNILMIHLQKIVFNLDTFMNEKIADRYEFPTYLNMENYTINKIAEKYNINDPELHNYASNLDKNFEYRLVGVIIHQGVAEAGHYYSLICTDQGLDNRDEETWRTTEGMKWTEFNDTLIKDFNFNIKFEDECFGKTSSDVYGPGARDADGFETWGAATGGSSKSAYVLIYEKREYKDIRMGVDTEVVKKMGKTQEQIDEEVEQEKKNYLKNLYSQYDSKHSDSLQETANESNENMEVSNDSDMDAFKQSLECGNIAIPRDLFPYLFVSDNRKIHMTQKQRDSLKYIPVVFDKENDECYINMKFKEIQKYIPYRTFKKVWDDNNSFSSERQLNNTDFFQFFRNTIKQENVIEQQNNQEKLALLYDLCVKMIFDMLVYAYHNEAIGDISDVLKRVLMLSDDTIVKFADYILTDNSNEFSRILYKCSDSSVRDNVSNILSTAVNRMFTRVDLIEKAQKFMTFMLGSIHTGASANWTKFEHFFNMIRQVTIGGEPQLLFMKENHVVVQLTDFFLAEKSPIRPTDEIRMCMGNNYSKPTFDSLVQTICFLSRHTDPREEDDKNPENLPPTMIDDHIFPPEENEKKLIVCRQFATKAIEDAFEADEVGKLIAHWSFQNEANSIVFAKVFLKGINEANYEGVAPFLTAMHHFLSLNDELQNKRLEWLLGTPVLHDGCLREAAPGENPKLGAYAVDALSGDIYSFPSTLESIDTSNESILSLIWKSKRRASSYTMFCIKELLTLGEEILKYISRMPSPNYQYARYTDWIEQFVEEKTISKSKEVDMYRETLVQVQQILEKYNEDVKYYDDELKAKHKDLYNMTDQELNYLTDPELESQNNPEASKSELIPEFKGFPRPYVIGKILSEKETCSDSTDHIRVEMTELECEWAWNKPIGKKQTTKKFMDHYVHRKTDLKEWNKPFQSTLFQKNKPNENFVGINPDKNTKEEYEKSGLKPILEDDDNDHVEDELPGVSKLGEGEEWGAPANQDEENINKGLNDREDEQCIDADGPRKILNLNNLFQYEKDPMNILNHEKEDAIDASVNFQKVAEKDEKEDADMQDVDISENKKNEQEDIIQTDAKSNFYEKDDIVIRLSVYNFLKKKIKVEIQLESQDDAPNFHIPLCSIKIEVPPNKAKTIAYFHKIHPGKPFGKYAFTYVSNADELAAADDPKPAPEASQSGVSFKEDVTVWPADDTNAENVQSEINCGMCTMLNPISGFNCSVCGTRLPHRT